MYAKLHPKFIRKVKTLVFISEDGILEDQIVCLTSDAYWVQDYEKYGSLLINNPELLQKLHETSMNIFLNPKMSFLEEMHFAEYTRISIKFLHEILANTVENYHLDQLMYIKFTKDEEFTNYFNFEILPITRKFNFFSEINILFFSFIFCIFIHISLLF